MSWNDDRVELLTGVRERGVQFLEPLLLLRGHHSHPFLATAENRFLNVGEERGKGNELTKAAFDLLEQTPAVNFAGNIEGRDILAHAADVVVCDGFVGNVILKLGESVASVLPKLVGAEMQHLGLPAEQQQIVAKTLSGVRKKFDYEEFGGAPLLGVDGNVIIGHGGSTVRAIENMVRSGAQLVRQGVRDALEKAA